MEEGSEVLSASLDAEMARHSLRIRDAFDLFDPGHTDMIAKKEVPSAIRYLNVFPKERELVIDILEAMQDDEPNEGFITYKNFHKEMIRILSLKLYPPASADLLMQAFRVIDTANLGFIDSEVIEKLLFTKGEAFRQQELDEFYSVSRNDETDRIMYEDYVSIACKAFLSKNDSRYS